MARGEAERMKGGEVEDGRSKMEKGKWNVPLLRRKGWMLRFTALLLINMKTMLINPEAMLIKSGCLLKFLFGPCLANFSKYLILVP